jgi:predicted lipoprotein
MRPTLLLCVLALALTACGAAARDSAKDFKGAERGVAAAVEDLESAARKNDSGQACTKLLAAGLLTALKAKGTTCETAVKEAFKDADSLDLTVEDVTISGTKASAKVTSGSGSHKKSDTLELERAGAGWRISSLRA